MSSDQPSPRLWFFVGTIAELIKLMPVMRELSERRQPFGVIASGQNDICRSELLPDCGVDQIRVVLHAGPIHQSVAGLLGWFARTLIASRRQLHRVLGGPVPNGPRVLVVHGDTVSTVLGAFIARRFGLRLAHIEAGLRSFHYLNPFPEEIDRVIVSRLADWHFAPNEWAAGNLSGRKGLIINTGFNTLIDSLQIALRAGAVSEFQRNLQGEPYFVFVLHRQENIYNNDLVRAVAQQLGKAAEKMKCVCVLHEPTRVRLERAGMLSLLQHGNILSVPRLPYFEFVQLLAGCKFIITDGGSNQEEAYYLGKPCLLLRRHTERIEGLGENARLWEGKACEVGLFVNQYGAYSRPPPVVGARPSVMIADALTITN